MGANKEIDLLSIVKKHSAGNRDLEDDLTYFSDYGWNLPQVLYAMEDSTDGGPSTKQTRAILKFLHRVWVDCGRYRVFTDEEYENCQTAGCRKNQMYPKVEGKRWRCEMGNSEFEEKYGHVYYTTD